MHIFLGQSGRHDSPGFHHINPNLRSLLELWEAQRGAGQDRKFPSRRKFTPQLLKPWLGHVSLVDVMREPPKFRIRLMGVYIVRLAGGDYTGRWLDDAVPAQTREDALRPFFECLETGAPVTDRAATGIGSIPATVDRLYLPCADDGVTVDTMLVGIYSTDKGAAYHAGP